MVDQDILDLIASKPWYHRIEVRPGLFTPGRYDPTQYMDVMGFPQDFSGKTVLDIGTFDGFFAFEAERRGAKRVLAIDRHPIDHRGFAIAHHLRGSNVEYRVSSVYDLAPEVHGVFDVVLFMGVLYHLRHPLLGIEKIHEVCKEYAFVETHVLDTAFTFKGETKRLVDLNPVLAETPILQFYPNDELDGDFSNWFAPNVRCVQVMLSSCGFRPTPLGRYGDRASFMAAREEFVRPYWY
jgi:tRNA (mo5U34)-methyltransferase